MPNWCENTLLIKGNKDAIAKFKKQADDGRTELSLNNFVQMPTEFEDIKTGGMQINGKLTEKWREVDGESIPVSQSELDELKTKYGADNWYDWTHKMWGTKWDVTADLLEQTKTTLKYGFESAWSPPSEWLRQVAIMFPTLHFELEYREEGCQFQGTIIADNTEFSDISEEFVPNDEDEEWED